MRIPANCSSNGISLFGGTFSSTPKTVFDVGNFIPEIWSLSAGTFAVEIPEQTNTLEFDDFCIDYTISKRTITSANVDIILERGSPVFETNYDFSFIGQRWSSSNFATLNALEDGLGFGSDATVNFPTNIQCIQNGTNLTFSFDDIASTGIIDYFNNFPGRVNCYRQIDVEPPPVHPYKILCDVSATISSYYETKSTNFTISCEVENKNTDNFSSGFKYDNVVSKPNTLRHHMEKYVLDAISNFGPGPTSETTFSTIVVNGDEYHRNPDFWLNHLKLSHFGMRVKSSATDSPPLTYLNYPTTMISPRHCISCMHDFHYPHVGQRMYFMDENDNKYERTVMAIKISSYPNPDLSVGILDQDVPIKFAHVMPFSVTNHISLNGMYLPYFFMRNGKKVMLHHGIHSIMSTPGSKIPTNQRTVISINSNTIIRTKIVAPGYSAVEFWPNTNATKFDYWWTILGDSGNFPFVIINDRAVISFELSSEIETVNQFMSELNAQFGITGTNAYQLTFADLSGFPLVGSDFTISPS